MKTTLRCGLIVSSLILAAGLMGLSRGKAPPPPPTSVAVVDLAKLTNSLDEAKILKERLKQQADDYQKKLQEVKDNREKAVKDLEQFPPEKKGTPEFLKKLAEKYELDATLEARGKGLQQLIDIAEGENMKIMFTNISEAVGRIGKERGYDLVLWDDRAIVAPAVVATGAQVWGVIRDRRILFAAERVDITNDVMTQMNNEYKVGKKVSP